MNTKASAALISVGGHLVETADSLDELKVRLFVIASAWNMAVESKSCSNELLKAFLNERQSDAPDASSIDELEFQIRRVMREKRRSYPDITKRIIMTDAIERADNDYLVRASFEPG